MSKKPIILAVDDESQNMMVFEETFGDDYDLRFAFSGNEALSLVSQIQPDVVLLDIMMPDLTGYEVCQKVREDQSLRFTKMIIVSAKSMVKERLKGYELGANDYVTKPFDSDELVAKVKDLIKLKYTEEINVLKENMLRFFSHELRTPLDGILGFTSILKQSPSLNDKDRSQLNQIIQEGNRLLDLSDRAVLSYELKKNFELFKEEKDMAGVVNEIVEQLQTESQQKEVHLSIKNYAKQKWMIDDRLIEKALNYILYSLITLSPKGSAIDIFITNENEWHQVLMRNACVSINEKDIKELFKEISSFDMTDYQKGQALSLFIAKNIAKLHGGDLLVSNDFEQGCAFILKIANVRPHE